MEFVPRAAVEGGVRDLNIFQTQKAVLHDQAESFSFRSMGLALVAAVHAGSLAADAPTRSHT